MTRFKNPKGTPAERARAKLRAPAARAPQSAPPAPPPNPEPVVRTTVELIHERLASIEALIIAVNKRLIDLEGDVARVVSQFIEHAGHERAHERLGALPHRLNDIVVKHRDKIKT